MGIFWSEWNTLARIWLGMQGRFGIGLFLIRLIKRCPFGFFLSFLEYLRDILVKYLFFVNLAPYIFRFFDILFLIRQQLLILSFLSNQYLTFILYCLLLVIACLDLQQSIKSRHTFLIAIFKRLITISYAIIVLILFIYNLLPQL